MKKKLIPQWLDTPEEHDYPAAESFLSLMFNDEQVTEHIRRLKAAPITCFKAKDIFRSSRLSLLGVSNGHVERDLKKIRKGKLLSPLLLIRDSLNAAVIIADGYHRLCAVYSMDEDATVPCKIA